MSYSDWLASRFEEHRPHLRAVAYRILGSASDAEDAVQDTWLRVNRSDTDSVDNLGGWLTTVVSRIALDELRARHRHKESSAGIQQHDVVAAGPDPEADALVADAVGMAMMVVLERLQPAERVAFVLHDTFGVSFADVGNVLGRSANAAKQLASRARRKVRGSDPVDRDPHQERRIVDAFLKAAHNGDLVGLLAVLDPEVLLQADPAAVDMGSPGDVRGAPDVAALFDGRALGATTVAIDGIPGVAWIVAGEPKVVWDMTIIEGHITHIDMLADADHLAEIELQQ